MVELSSLDGVVSYKEVNGHHIAHNVSKVPSSGSLSNGGEYRKLLCLIFRPVSLSSSPSFL